MPETAQQGAPNPVQEAASLYEESQIKLGQDDYEAAINLLRQAASLDTENQEYISSYGSMLAELNRTEEAVQVLQEAVQRFPDNGFEKYMYLGQLLEGEAAIQSLEVGLRILQSSIQEAADPQEARDLGTQLASGLCSLAEMHMLSDDEGISEGTAQTCEALLQRAQEADKRSPEPLQVMASLRHEQERLDEALQLLRQSLALWWRPPPGSSLANGNGLENGMAGVHGEDDEAMDEDLAVPSFEFKFVCAKLLIQLDESTDTAIGILEELLEENDQNVHLYFLLAMAHHAGSSPEAALEYINEGQELMQRSDPAPDYANASDYATAMGFQRLKDIITSQQAAADAG